MAGPAKVDLTALTKTVNGLEIAQSLPKGSPHLRSVSLTYKGASFPAVMANLTNDNRYHVDRSALLGIFRDTPALRNALQ